MDGLQRLQDLGMGKAYIYIFIDFELKFSISFPCECRQYSHDIHSYLRKNWNVHITSHRGYRYVEIHTTLIITLKLLGPLLQPPFSVLIKKHLYYCISVSSVKFY